MARSEQLYSPGWIRWGAIIAGAVIGIGVMVLLSSLWVAIAQDVTAVSNNLHWYSFVSAVVALLIAGLFAGWLSGVRGPGTGLLHGLTVWGLVLVASVAFPLPATLRLFDVFQAELPEIGAGPTWASFFGILIGLIAAVIGGLLGGALTRPHETSFGAPQSGGSSDTASEAASQGEPYTQDPGARSGSGSASR
ncbi:hypothetical protein [Haloechinothrix sp. LS1_15]|uniref:hypothetical protein n=1 Tax=Haloechinothrix sp. LS1_15 TaxID=2652248 RepID=UPI002945652C|nr:hypothetical protein [Haloechinothrix sp. LS1_15]MDV6012735.1 hypothetical protein [Haloechinothrix sp. LS1_15]